MAEPRELTWAKDEVIKNGGTIVYSGEDQQDSSIAFLKFRTKDGKSHAITFDPKAMLPEECIREMVRFRAA